MDAVLGAYAPPSAGPPRTNRDGSLHDAPAMIEALFWLKQLVKLVVLPPNGPLLLIIGGLAMAGRKPATGRRIAFAGVLLIVIFAMPIVPTLLIRALDRTPVLD